jgi:hypothetical protein
LQEKGLTSESNILTLKEIPAITKLGREERKNEKKDVSLNKIEGRMIFEI